MLNTEIPDKMKCREILHLAGRAVEEKMIGEMARGGGREGKKMRGKYYIRPLFL